MERSRDDIGAEGSASGLPSPRAFDAHVGFDATAKVYFVLSSEIPGLNIEAPTFETFVEVALDAAPDLLDRGSIPARIDFRQTFDLLPVDGGQRLFFGSIAEPAASPAP